MAFDLDSEQTMKPFLLQIALVLFEKDLWLMTILLFGLFFFKSSLQFKAGLLQTGLESFVLPFVKLRMKSDEDRSLFFENLGPSSMNPVGADRFRIVLQGNPKKLREMRGLQTSNEGNALAVSKLNIFLRVISLVHDQGESIGGLRQVLIAMDQKAEGLRKQFGIMLVACIDLMQKGKPYHRRRRHSQTNQPLVRPPLLGFSPLGQLRGSQTIHMGGKVGSIPKQDIREKVITSENLFPKLFFNRLQMMIFY